MTPFTRLAKLSHNYVAHTARNIVEQSSVENEDCIFMKSDLVIMRKHA